ncbi:effector-associated constant component EACC1 [Nonomuraea sediminis]|uniref:effector-associated constant component EACC1 n=1 Tax=Nonomuraea sediminis TaxID=2835864 RepID=UPI001BDC56D7|nr:hypothetical protein [Nonomuraea sediminis]
MRTPVPDVSLEGDPDLLHSLEEWLRDVDALRGRVRLEQRAPAPGRMGADPALVVAVESDGQRAALSRTVELWLRMRGGDVTLKFRVGPRVTELDLRGDVDVELVLRQVDTLIRQALSDR